MASRMDLMHRVEGLTTTLSVQIVALKEHTVLGETSNVHTSIGHCLQLHTLSDIRSGLFGSSAALDICQRANAEAVLAR